MDDMPRCLAILAVSLFLAMSCGSVRPTPQEFSEDLPPRRQLSPAERDRVQRESEAALMDLLAGRYEEARDRARTALETDPRSVRALAVLGRSLGALAWANDLPDHVMAQEAEGHLLLALRLDPTDAEARLFYAQLLVVEGHLSRAGRELDQLLEHHPRYQPALRAAADVRYELSEERAAAALLSRLLTESPGDAWALFRLAHCRVQLADAHLRGDSRLADNQDRVAVAVAAYRLAAKTFAEYQDISRDDPAGYLGEAHARYRALVAGRQDRAAKQQSGDAIVALFQKARTLDPKNPATFHGEGAVFDLLEQEDRARRAYNEALRLDANHVPSLLNLAALRYGAGEKKAAQDLWRRVLKLDITPAEKREIRKLLKEK
jgi:tetratricopeptide (TPR) repeat protein